MNTGKTAVAKKAVKEVMTAMKRAARKWVTA